MGTDLQTMLLGKLYTILTADATLATAMGSAWSTTSPWLYQGWAKPDAPLPYICHLFADLRANEGEWITRSGTYLVHIWSSSNNTDEVMAIKDRIVTLVDEQDWDISSGGTEYVTALRLKLQTEMFVIEETEDVWHYTMQFNVRLIRKGEINNILSR